MKMIVSVEKNYDKIKNWDDIEIGEIVKGALTGHHYIKISDDMSYGLEKRTVYRNQSNRSEYQDVKKATLFIED